MRRLKMSAKTKIVVLHMKELIYTLIFAGLGILLIFLLLFMFLPGKEDGESVETMRYVAGVYTSSIQFGEHAVDMQVIVDENRIQSVSMVNLSRSFFADSSYMLSFSVLCSCVCSRLISPSVSSWHKQDNTLMHQSPGHIQRRTPYNF